MGIVVINLLNRCEHVPPQRCGLQHLPEGHRAHSPQPTVHRCSGETTDCYCIIPHTCEVDGWWSDQICYQTVKIHQGEVWQTARVLLDSSWRSNAILDLLVQHQTRICSFERYTRRIRTQILRILQSPDNKMDGSYILLSPPEIL